MESLGQQQIYHFSHGHPLELTEMKHDDEILCSACQKQCSGETYACCSSKCKFFLHYLCFNLPQNICHPFHLHHPLTLYSPVQHQLKPECKVCYRSCSGFTYSCNHCKFHMHVECPVMTSPIKFQGHHHNILFVDGLDPCQTYEDDDPSKPSEINTAFLCSACGISCESSDAMFHCVECDFHLHFRCGPLPCSIDDKENHPCSLKLTDSPVMVEGGDKGGDWFVCDACQEDRDPRLPVYYCSNGCAYIVEIKCIISKVMLSLMGEYGEVELRSAIFKHQTGKVICKEIEITRQDISIAESGTEVGKSVDNPSLSMAEIMDSLPNEEKARIMFEFECALNIFKDHDSWFINSSSDEDYTKFMALMDTFDNERDLPGFWQNDIGDRNTKNLADLWRNNKPVINIGSHLVISDLAPILEDLCAKYGNTILEPTELQISTWGMDCSGARTFFVNTFCETIRSMCTTRVADISEAKLFRWWRSLKTLHHVGFKVQFALNRLKRVVHAYYALQDEKTVKCNLEEIDRKIARVSHDIIQSEAKLVAQKAKLVALKERRNRIKPPKPASSTMVAECFKESSELKWMIVGEGLL